DGGIHNRLGIGRGDGVENLWRIERGVERDEVFLLLRLSVGSGGVKMKMFLQFRIKVLELGVGDALVAAENNVGGRHRSDGDMGIDIRANSERGQLFIGPR